MRNVSEFDNLMEDIFYAKQKLESVKGKLLEKYGVTNGRVLNLLIGENFVDDIDICLENNIGDLARALKLMKFVSGNVFLEIGCGGFPYSPDGIGRLRSTNWEPWLCRILHELDYYVIGIDVGELDSESFVGFGGVDVTNFSNSSAYRKIGDESVDVLYLGMGFCKSPTLSEILGDKGIKKENFFEKLLKDFKPKLKKDGIIYPSLGKH